MGKKELAKALAPLFIRMRKEIKDFSFDPRTNEWTTTFLDGSQVKTVDFRLGSETQLGLFVRGRRSQGETIAVDVWKYVDEEVVTDESV